MYNFSYPWLDVRETKPVSCCLCVTPTSSETCFEYQVNEQTFTIQRCLAHDLLFVSPQPAGAFFDTLYNHPSYYQGDTDMYGLKVDEEKATKTGAIRAGEAIEVVGPISSFLEIGCAYGHTLDAVRNLGVKTIQGIELSEDAVNVCTQKNIPISHMSGPEDFSALGGKQFDAIALYSVVEHVPNPVTYLEKLLPYLSANGQFIIRLPRMSKDGPWLSLIDHIWHFTDQAVHHLAERLGLTIVKTIPSGTFIGLEHGGELKSFTYFIRR